MFVLCVCVCVFVYVLDCHGALWVKQTSPKITDNSAILHDVVLYSKYLAVKKKKKKKGNTGLQGVIMRVCVYVILEEFGGGVTE